MKDPWKIPDTQDLPKSQRFKDWQERMNRAEGLHSDPPKKTKKKKHHITGMIVFAVVLGLIWFFLPESSHLPPRFYYLITLLAFLVSGLFFIPKRETFARLRMLMAWFAIFAGIGVLYHFMDGGQADTGAFFSRLDPSHVGSDGSSLKVRRSQDGHFWIRAQVNDVPVNMMVDTGASQVVLSPGDATRIGLDINTLNFNGLAETANGTVQYARAHARIFELGDHVLHSVPVTINGAEMKSSLLGMSVLDQFSSIEFRGDTLILTP